ncbi:MAG TPA: hypothetical protein VMI54_17995 [Polyangiaceae bacterium]|nr:hypothetical protein [Polyangiaceae bacterium]
MAFHRNLHRWLAGYVSQRVHERVRERKTPAVDGPRHVLFALCDHYEPLWGDVDRARGRDRVERWARGYAPAFSEFRDADGRAPRHSFFFPGEQYEPRYLDLLGGLVVQGYGEVEVHLHHDGDDAQKLAHDLGRYTAAYAEHGHLTRDRDGRPRYAFIHGNWCLANSRPDGRYCGVDSELAVLFETGCYADFTFPSAPDSTQPNIVNQIYWPTGDPSRARAHEHGTRARVGTVMRDRILMIQGPLALARRKLGFRIESSALTARDPGTPERVATWVAQDIHVEGRPEWLFVKVHTHGAPETQAEALLGEPGRALHRELTRRYNDGKRFVLHYVSAREMFNIALAGMQGLRGDPNLYRDHALPPPPLAA